MKKKTVIVFVIMALTSICMAETSWQLQAVDGTGDGIYEHLTDMYKPTIEGIILNKPENMVDSAEEWQIYIQGEDTDHAGTAVYMRKSNWGGGVYTDTEWAEELYRVSNDPNGNYEFKPGDRVRVTGLTKFYNGKTNINERHSTDSDNDFTIDLVDPAAGLPEPEVITLSTVKDGNDNCIFDANRTLGCEYYQAQLVRINDVNIVGSNWGIGQGLQIRDNTGRTFPLLLGRGEGFAEYAMPTGQIDVIGIFDQESSDYKTGYRIWVMNYDGNGTVLTDNCGLNGYHSGDINRDCVVDFADFAELAANWLKCSNLSFGDCTEP